MMLFYLLRKLLTIFPKKSADNFVIFLFITPDIEKCGSFGNIKFINLRIVWWFLSNNRYWIICSVSSTQLLWFSYVSITHELSTQYWIISSFLLGWSIRFFVPHNEWLSSGCVYDHVNLFPSCLWHNFQSSQNFLKVCFVGEKVSFQIFLYCSKWRTKRWICGMLWFNASEKWNDLKNTLDDLFTGIILPLLWPTKIGSRNFQLKLSRLCTLKIRHILDATDIPKTKVLEHSIKMEYANW